MVLLSRWALPLAAAALALVGWQLHEQNAQLGELAGRIDRLSEAVAEHRSGPVDPRVICSGSTVGAEAIGTVVADRLARRLQGSPAPNATAATPDGGAPGPASPAPSEEQRQQLERARQLVSAAVESGVLRKEDVRELRQLRDGAGDPKAFEELTGQLIRAINQGRLRPEDPRFALP